jgi:hypothetical protein
MVCMTKCDGNQMFLLMTIGASAIHYIDISSKWTTVPMIFLYDILLRNQKCIRQILDLITDSRKRQHRVVVSNKLVSFMGLVWIIHWIIRTNIIVFWYHLSYNQDRWVYLCEWVNGKWQKTRWSSLTVLIMIFDKEWIHVIFVSIKQQLYSYRGEKNNKIFGRGVFQSDIHIVVFTR